MHPVSAVQEPGQELLVPSQTNGEHAPLRPVVPAPVAVQRPREPATLHFAHVEQLPEQHTPSAQRPDAHWLSAVHVVPRAALARHEPPEQ